MNKISNIDKKYFMEELQKIMQEEEYIKAKQDMIFKENYMNIGHAAEASVRRKTSKKDLASKLSRSIEYHEKEIARSKETMQKIETIKYDVGQAVFHKTLGNVIIQDIYLETDQYLDVKADFTDGYVYQVVGVDGRGVAREHELSEITEITKNLYGE